MADIAKSGTPSMITRLPCPAHQVAGDIFAGEALAAGDNCCMSTVDGLIYKVNPAVAARKHFMGVIWIPARAGEAVSLHSGVTFSWSKAGLLVPGKWYYNSAVTLGGIADAPSLTLQIPVAWAVDKYKLRFSNAFFQSGT